jgi:diguanylate cyclase (GGDEF)-like protein
MSIEQMMISESSKPLILIVDDTPINIQVLAEGLLTDYRVKVATSGRAALEIITKQGLPDLILLDVMMPEMDGYEVCHKLKQNPETKGIPIIFVTAKNEVADEEYGLKLGAVDYITKPFHLSIVKARVKSHLQLQLMSNLLAAMAWIDGLTGVSNRRHFDEMLETEWKRAQRAGTLLSVIMVDVDHFKQYNDHYGHGAGDTCLKKIASTLSTSVTRAGDFVARYGGEEFVLLIPEIKTHSVRQLAEDLCQCIEAQKIPHDHSSASPWVTISVGYASVIPDFDGSTLALLEAADQMLYTAKNAGRNRAHGI